MPQLNGIILGDVVKRTNGKLYTVTSVDTEKNRLRVRRLIERSDSRRGDRPYHTLQGHFYPAVEFVPAEFAVECPDEL